MWRHITSISFLLQPHTLTLIVEYSNYVFIGVFTLEMVMKLLAEGFLQYIKDAFNVFDGFIVIMRYDAGTFLYLRPVIEDNYSVWYYFD